MKFAATVLFFITIISVAACSRLPQPAVSHGNVQTQESSNLHTPAISLNLGTLTCEPEGLINLPEGQCVGKAVAIPTMVDGTCTCRNEAYVAIPNTQGFTCVHLISVLETIRVLREKILELGISESDSDGPLNLDADGEEAVRLALSVLLKDLTKIDHGIRMNALPKRFSQTVRYAQYTLERVTKNQTKACASTPGPISRQELFAHYPPIP